MKKKEETFIELFSGTLWEAEMVTSLLHEAEIESFLKNSVLNSYVSNPIYSEGVKVMILGSDWGRAREIADEYCRNMKTNIPGKEQGLDKETF